MAAHDRELDVPGPFGGRLVGIEGDVDLITRQLHLLPPSRKILIIPSMPTGQTTPISPQRTRHSIFPPPTAQSIIQEVRVAFNQRVDTARAFLRRSTPQHPRIVFMNGGSLHARATCIARISEYITQGDLPRAEAIFADIVRTGPAGLELDEMGSQSGKDSTRMSEAELKDGYISDGVRECYDPILRAMMAADSLDRETAVLQYVSGERTTHGGVMVFTPVTTTPRLSGIPWKVKGYASGVSDSGESNAQKPPPFTAEEYEFLRTALKPASRCPSLAESRSTFGRRRPRPISTATRTTTSFYSQVPDEEEGEASDAELPTPKHTDHFFSDGHNSLVEFGVANMVDMQTTAPMAPVRKSRSHDRLSSSTLLHEEGSQMLQSLKHSTSDPSLASSAESRPASLYTLPRSVFKPSEPSSKKPSPTSRKGAMSPRLTLRISVEQSLNSQPSELSQSKESSAPSEPLFPMVEDMVIHFMGGARSEALESVFRTCRGIAVPATPLSPAAESPRSVLSPLSANSSMGNRISFDPFAKSFHEDAHNALTSPDHHHQELRTTRLSKVDHSTQNAALLTPATTPPPIVNDNADKICEFYHTGSRNTIVVQNSFREFLQLHFPTGKNGYSQNYYSVSPEQDRLWKPVFRYDNSNKKSAKTVDQIIAFGCEDGVDREFFDRISGQVERLGIKKDGESRSGRLDLRYLISQAMERVSENLLDVSATMDPLSEPALLATLIVPQIEAYLATNATTRLLVLHFSTSQLPTVLALRRYIGTDTFKIAGIVDSLSSDPPAYSSPRKLSRALSAAGEAATAYALANAARKHSRSTSNESIINRARMEAYRVRVGSIQTTRQLSIIPPTSPRSPRSPMSTKTMSLGASFSKANYLLPSTATSEEVTTFLSEILKPLIEKANFYTPEIQEAPGAPPTPTSPVSLNPSFPSFPPNMHSRPSHHRRDQSQSISKISRLTGVTPGLLPAAAYAASVTSLATTTVTEMDRREERERGDQRDRPDWDSYTMGEVDSEDDAYDRMVMGRAGAKIVPEKRRPSLGRKKANRQKALKWLGLA